MELSKSLFSANKSTKLEKLPESGPLWKSFTGSKSQASFESLIQVLQRELSQMELDSCDFPKRFWSALQFHIKEKLAFAISDLKNSFEFPEYCKSALESLVVDLSLFQYCISSQNSQKLDSSFESLVGDYISCFFNRLTAERVAHQEQVLRLAFLVQQTLFSLVIYELNKRLQFPFMEKYLELIEAMNTQENFVKWASVPFMSIPLNFTNRKNCPMLPTDLQLFALWGVKKFLKKTNRQTETLLKKILPCVFISVFRYSEKVNAKNTDYYKITLRKSLETLKILKLGSSSKDLGLEFIEEHSEKVKNLFYKGIMLFCSWEYQMIAEDYKEDKTILGSFYRVLFDIASVALGTDHERLPVLTFYLLQQPEMLLALQNKPPLVQLYTLQFLNSYLKQLTLSSSKASKFTYMIDVGIINLLFTEPLFFETYEEDSFGLFSKLKETWLSIWNYLTQEPQDIQWISNCLVSLLQFYEEDVGFNLQLSKWINQQVENCPLLIQYCIKEGFLEHLLKLIRHLKLKRLHSEQIPNLFLMVRSALVYENLLVHANVAKVVELLLNEQFLQDENLIDFCTSSISAVLSNFDDPEPFKVFSQKLGTILNTKTAAVLCNVMQETLFRSNKKQQVQRYFVVEAKALEYLTDKLASGPSIWGIVFENMRFLVEQNPFCKNYLSKNIDFFQVAKKLQSPQFVHRDSIENLMFILCGTKHLEGPLQVATPEVVPLLLKLLLQESFSEDLNYFRSVLVTIVDDEVNAAHFACNGAIEVLLRALEGNFSEELERFIQDVLSLSIPHHISPQELRKLLSLSESRSFLLPTLLNAIEYCMRIRFSADVGLEKNIEVSHSHPTSYFCFRKENSFLRLSSELLPKKEFSCFMWFYPLVTHEQVLVEFSNLTGHHLRLMIARGKLALKYRGAKAKYFAETQGKIDLEEWNLVGMTMRYKKKLMKQKEEIYIFLNGFKLKLKITGGSLCIPKERMSILTLANDFKLKLPFKGKVHKFYLSNLSYQEYHFARIFHIPPEFDFSFSEKAESSFTKRDFNSTAEISKGVFLEWNTNYQFPITSLTDFTVEESTERINGVNVVQAISAIGGLKMFLPAMKNQDMVILECIKWLCNTEAIERIAEKDFFEILEIHISKVFGMPTLSLLNVVRGIIDAVEWDYSLQKKVFHSLVLSEKIWKKVPLDLEKDFLEVLEVYVPRILYRNDLPMLYMFLKGIEVSDPKTKKESFYRILEGSFLKPSEDTFKDEKAVLNLLVLLLKDKSEILSKVLSLVYEKKASMESEKLRVIMQHILKERKKDPQIQNQVVLILAPEEEKPLSSRNSRSSVDFSLETSRKKLQAKKIFSELDRNLGEEVFPLTVETILDIVLQKTQYFGEAKKTYEDFVNLITKRIPKNKSASKVLEVLSEKCKHSEELYSILVYRDNFPNWVVGLYGISELIDIQLNSFGLLVFSKTDLFKNYNKLRIFLISLIRSHKGFNEALKFYSDLLNIIDSEGFTKREVFLDFIAVLEDLFDPQYNLENQEIDNNLFCCILKQIVDVGFRNNLLFCTHPNLPWITFQDYLNLLRERPLCKTVNFQEVWLREGGFLRVILKLILIGLNIEVSEELVDELKKVLKLGSVRGSYLTLTSSLKLQWEKLLKETQFQKYTYSYKCFQGKQEDMLYTQEFLIPYVITECTEIIYKTCQNYQYNEPIVKFLKEFIKDTDSTARIQASLNALNPEELKHFYIIMSDYIENFYTTCRSYLPSKSRCLFPHMCKLEFDDSPMKRSDEDQENLVPALSDLKSKVRELCGLLNSAVDSEDDSLILKLLAGDTKGDSVTGLWIRKVHLLLMAQTSMKLNFIWEVVRQFSLPSETSLSLSQEFEEFKVQFENILEQLKLDTQRKDKRELTAQKSYQSFLKHYKNLQTQNEPPKFIKLKNRIDALGRTPYTEAIEKLQGPKSVLSVPPVPSEPLSSAMVHSDYQQEDLLIEEFSSESEEENIEPLIKGMPVMHLLCMDCERIKVECSHFGELIIDDNSVYFCSKGELKPDTEEYIGSALPYTGEVKDYELIFYKDQIKEVFARKFMQQHTALEIFLNKGKSILLNVFKKHLRDQVLSRMKDWRAFSVVTDLSYKSIRKFTKKWKEGKMSNFEYLMILNKYSSRSFNDITQYPIFPWVISDYQSETLNLKDPSTFRNLVYPIGAQTLEACRECDQKFQMWKEEELEAFHHGSHYSSTGIVSHYLVRLPPFTGQAIALQGGRFDVADRLFLSFKSSWESCVSPSGDVKEMIPEMFYLPEALMNNNHEDLGITQTGKTVNDVELPPWANSSYDFVRKHRQALECSFVSENLSHWIDLVFGYKQRGPLAEKFYNVFYSITYEESVQSILANSSKKDTKAFFEQIAHYGQTPVRLFNSPHPKKAPKKEIEDFFSKIEDPNYEIDSRSLKEFRVKHTNIHSVFATDQALVAVSSTHKLQIYVWKWKYIDKQVQPHLYDLKVYDLAETVNLNTENWCESQQWKYLSSEPLSRVLEKGPYSYCLFKNKFLVSGLHPDNSCKLHKLDGTLHKSIYHHAGLVVCVACTKDLVFTGSLDTSIAAWNFDQIHKGILQPYSTFLGHSAPVKQVSVSHSYQLLASLSNSGSILLHDIRTTECFRKLSSGNILPDQVAFSEFGVVIADKVGVIEVFSVNGDLIRQEKRFSGFEITCMHFDKSQEKLVIGGDRGFVCTKIFQEEEPFYLETGVTVKDIVASPNEEFLVAPVDSQKVLLIEFLSRAQKETIASYIDFMK